MASQPPISTEAALPARVPTGWAQQVACDPVRAAGTPTTTAGVPPISTLWHTPRVTGAANGSGGAGCGAPLAGLGIRCIGHVPVTWSLATAAGVPIAFWLL